MWHIYIYILSHDKFRLNHAYTNYFSGLSYRKAVCYTYDITYYIIAVAYKYAIALLRRVYYTYGIIYYIIY